MGLIITSDLSTSGGNTSEAYVNIKKYTLSKGEVTGFDVWLNLYVNKAASMSTPMETVTSNLVYFRVGTIDVTDLNLETIYAFAYSIVKEKLEANGLVVIDDI